MLIAQDVCWKIPTEYIFPKTSKNKKEKKSKKVAALSTAESKIRVCRVPIEEKVDNRNGFKEI